MWYKSLLQGGYKKGQ